MGQKHRRRRGRGAALGYERPESDFSLVQRKRRMRPLIRSIVLSSLVILALSELAGKVGLLEQDVTSMISVFSLVLLLIALYIDVNQPPRGGGGWK